MNLTLQTSVACNRTDNMMVPNEEKEYRLSLLQQTRRLMEEEAKCSKLIQQTVPTADMMCPPIWDYVMCWNATEAGTTVVQPCPNYIHKFLLNVRYDLYHPYEYTTQVVE
uniref:G-protein coupled receptors family 2 profile 1 domain-containing protein n=1 Tax=Magallana gigas TaxID=29159 RepID=A0A8W8NMV4_MAGGI